MIYVYTDHHLENTIKNTFEEILSDIEMSIEFDNVDNLSYDIYLIEVNKIGDLEKIEIIDRTYSPLVYIVSLQDYDLVSHAISKNIHMYFGKNNTVEDLLNKKEEIKRQILNKFKYYPINRGPIKIKLRTSQIIYVESINHEIIIHSTTGETTERKALSQFVKDINLTNFIQIHKSFVVNSLFISQIKNKQVILKNGDTIPIGKKFEKLSIML